MKNKNMRNADGKQQKTKTKRRLIDGEISAPEAQITRPRHAGSIKTDVIGFYWVFFDSTWFYRFLTQFHRVLLGLTVLN